MVAAKKSRGKPSEELVPSRYMAAVIERIEERNRATLEHVDASIAKLGRDLRERFDSLEIRVSALELTIRLLVGDVRQLDRRLEQVEAEVREVRALLDRKVDQAAVESLRARVRALEERLGMVTP